MVGVRCLRTYQRRDLRRFVELMKSRVVVRRDTLELSATVLELLDWGRPRVEKGVGEDA